MRQLHKNSTFTSIPSGTATISALKLALEASDCHQNPNDAGTIVVGIDASTPPTRPPKRSIATVATIATKPANKAESVAARNIDNSQKMGETVTVVW